MSKNNQTILFHNSLYKGKFKSKYFNFTSIVGFMLNHKRGGNWSTNSYHDTIKQATTCKKIRKHVLFKK